jgi:hypothetical protein
MIRFHQNGKDLIAKACAGATTGIICTPYYTERGLRLLDPFFDTAEDIEFWTRFSPLDWKAGVADMAALRKRVQSITNRKKAFRIWVSDDLHAKIFAFLPNTIIVGSANLTWPAMTSNIEVICELTGAEAVVFERDLPTYRSRLTPVPVDAFGAYVEVVADVVSKPFEGPAEEDADMNAAIDLAEERLRDSFAPAAPEIPPLVLPEIQDFFKYCQREKSSVAREIVERAEGKHSLQGHVKHCFYGAAQFLSEHPDFIGGIAATRRDSLYDFTDSSIRAQWRDFLHEHAKEIDKQRQFSFHTLRVYLPPNLGGICSGGGGGSGTLKRVLPMVARMLQSQREKKRV